MTDDPSVCPRCGALPFGCVRGCGGESQAYERPTDDPSTNSGEWVCKYADNGFVTDCTEDSPHYICSPPAATPSPVPDSERPATKHLRRIISASSDSDATRELIADADWIDAHRCPTPEGDVLAELRKLSDAAAQDEWFAADSGEVYNYPADWIAEVYDYDDRVFIAAAVNFVRRLLASHPGGEQ